MADTLVAVDVGTSGARATAFSVEGERLLEVRRGYATTSPPGWAEQDPRGWRSAAIGALAGLVRQLGSRRRVVAIGLTGQCPSVCLVDRRGDPIGPGLIYRDNRATAEAAAIRERLGDATVHARTGHRAAAFHVGLKLMWLKGHQPDIFARAHLALQPRDLVGHALTGEFATDGTHAAATLAFDLRRRAWADDLVDAMGLRWTSSLPCGHRRSRWAGHALRRPTRRAAAGTPVILGGADSQACALGAGVVAEGPVSEMAGSSTCLNAAVKQPLSVLDVTHYPHVVPGPYTTETGINTTGAAVAWIADLLYAPRGRRAGAADYDRLDARWARRPPEPMACWRSRSWATANGPIRTCARRSRASAPRPRRAGARDDGGCGLRDPRPARPPDRRRRTRDRAARLRRRRAARLVEPHQGRRHRRAGGHGAGRRRWAAWRCWRGWGRDLRHGRRGNCYVRADDPALEPDERTRSLYDERFAAWRELVAAAVARRDN